MSETLDPGAAEWGAGTGSLVVVPPFFDNAGCSSCWGMLFTAVDCCWGPSLLLCVDKCAPRFDGLWVRGLGSDIVDDETKLGDVGARRTYPGFVFWPGPLLFEQGMDGAGLADLVIV